MEAENLTPENAEELDVVLERMKKNNPELTHQIFPMEEKTGHPEAQAVLELWQEVKALHRAVEDLANLIRLVFGDHVLVKGRFVRQGEPPCG